MIRQLPISPPFLTLTLNLRPHPVSHTNTMAQGKVKGLKTSKQKATRQASSSTTKKGKRYVAPKKADAIKIASLKKVRMQTLPVFLSLACPFGGKGFVGLGSKSRLSQGLSAKINRSIEKHTVNAASSGKLTIMKNVGSEDAKKASSSSK